MKYEYTLTGTIDAKGSIHLKGKSSDASILQFSGTVETPNTMKLTDENSYLVNPESRVRSATNLYSKSRRGKRLLWVS